MILERLHPILREWFESRFQNPTDIQQRALRHTLGGRNTLILAPTGSGKTLSAFLSVLSDLASRQLPNAVSAVYISPLKSLDRDIHRNLLPAMEALNAALPPGRQVRMEIRTGDTEPADRERQARKRPHLLLTTPESVAAILSQRGWVDVFDTQQCLWTRSILFVRASEERCLPSHSNALRQNAGAPCSELGCRQQHGRWT
jgi:ATP-dependent Lhr-like helicase